MGLSHKLLRSRPDVMSKDNTFSCDLPLAHYAHRAMLSLYNLFSTDRELGS